MLRIYSPRVNSTVSQAPDEADLWRIDHTLPNLAPTSYSRISLRQVRTTASAARSTSSDVVARPSVSRTDPRASTAGIPIANNTPEAVSPPSWHADPVDAAISGVAARS